MPPAAEHILPVLLVIAVGWAIRRLGVIDDAGRIAVERLTYYVLFPSLLFLSLARTDFSQFPAASTGATLFAALLVLAAVCLTLRPLLEKRLAMDGAAFTSVFQGATRWNTFIGLAVAGSLYGTEGLALISVAIVAIVPMVNLMCVVVLARYAAKSPPTLGTIFAAVLRNPFIWACLLGIAANLIGFVPPGPIEATLDIMGAAAVATGLVTVGASLDVAALRRPAPLLFVATLLKLGLMPLVGLGFAWLFGVTGTALGVTVIALAVPTATNAYILARELGGDAPLMAEIITFQTVISMATMPLWIALVAH